MRLVLATAVSLAAHPAAGEDWQKLSGVEIADALTEQIVDYDNAWQDFRASGQTLYFAGSESWGTWDVQNDKYCSQWPPNTAWTCYDVDLSSDRSLVRFRGAGDDISIGRFRADK